MRAHHAKCTGVLKNEKRSIMVAVSSQLLHVLIWFVKAQLFLAEALPQTGKQSTHYSYIVWVTLFSFRECPIICVPGIRTQKTNGYTKFCLTLKMCAFFFSFNFVLFYSMFSRFQVKIISLNVYNTWSITSFLADLQRT